MATKVKFSKEFKKQMVLEWTEAYMDYYGLKRILKDILLERQSKQMSTPSEASQHRFSLHGSFSGLSRRSSSLSSHEDVENQVIDVKKEEKDGSREFFRTKFLKQSEDGEETEENFFRKLDEELNKVNAFYKDKVEEVMNEADSLNKQMDAMVALRMKVANPDSGVDTTRMTRSEKSREETMEVLERVKINNPPESPVSTIKGVFGDQEEELKFEKDELKRVEAQLRLALIEFYQKLHLLKHYSYMNLSAFSKILKKYDKITLRRASRPYMKILDDSYLGSSDKVTSLMEKVEAIFIRNFSQFDRKKAMKSLRPKAKKEKHSVTFFSGFFFGCSVVLLVAIILSIEVRKLMDRQEGTSYMANIVPLYSFFAYIVVHMLVYAADIYLWRQFGINYPFIFSFKRGTELGYREVFLLSTGLSVLCMGSFLANLHLDTASGFRNKTVTQLFPLGLVTVVLIILFCPLDIIYHSSRFFFIRTLFRCLCAPLYKVELPDFFLLDQLCSQVQAIRSLELYVCYYGMEEFSKMQKKCRTHGLYNVLYFVVAIIPYWLRLLQCIRRLVEEKDSMHIFGALNYILTITAVLLRTTFEMKKQMAWMVLALICSAITMIYSTISDIVEDWGLLQRHSKNFYLRDKLLVPYKGVYYAAMVLDMVLRLDWLQLVLAFNLRSFKKVTITMMLSCLEIVRRGMWNFFRLENEHLNNVGKYRAFKSVPLPFSYNDEDDEDSTKNV